MTVIPVVAAALVGSDGRILMQKRRLGGMHAGLWEFPGGKVKGGETLEQALIREIQEELGVHLDPSGMMPVTFASDPALPPAPREPFVILLYTCRKWEGVPACLEGEAISWFEPSEIGRMAREPGKLPPLDVPLAIALLSAI